MKVAEFWIYWKSRPLSVIKRSLAGLCPGGSSDAAAAPRPVLSR